MADRSRVLRLFKLVLLASLLGVLLLRGVMPAWTGITDDFPEYFTSAKSVREGEDPAKLYDGDWFRAQTRRYHVGTGQNPGEFTPYPPPTALLLTPLTSFKPLTALRIVTVLNVALLVCSAFLLRRIFGWRLVDSALFVLASGLALLSGLRLGHPYILISMCCLLGYYFYRNGRPWLGGVLLGLFVPIKYFPLAVLAGFALYRQWRVVLGGAMAIAAVTLVSMVALGWEVHRIFLHDVILNHLSGHLIEGPRFTAIFQSIDTLVERLLIFDAVKNPHPWLNAPQAVAAAIAATKLLLLLLAGLAIVKLASAAATRTLAPAIGILGITVLLVAPGSGTYAYVLLWLPCALLIDFLRAEGARTSALLILSGYVLIGFIPYRHAYQFEGDGLLSVLAYPRLLLLFAMFFVSVHAAFFPAYSRRAPLPRMHTEAQNV